MSVETSDPTSVPTSSPLPQPVNEIFAGGTFTDLGLRGSVLKGIESAGFTQPTAIQAKLIPAVLAGKDVLGQAKTGTGKTAAFALPLLHLATAGVASQALILAPTRELAIQIAAEIDELGQNTPIRCAAIFGGQRISAQKRKLDHAPELIVGTPGRVMDMMGRGMLKLDQLRFVVLDEVDRMLDIGFREDIKKVMRACPKTRQTVFVSATISGDIEALARTFMRDPVKIVTAAGSLTVSLVEQHYLAVNPWDKKRLLLHLLKHEEPVLTVVFCRLKRSVDQIAKYLCDKGIDAHAIHADLGQGARNRTMAKLRAGELGVLVASDLASRGIDVDGISHVINYDMPDDIELYVHRIGRTARAGRGGVAWSFVTPEQGGLLTDIEKLINLEIPKLDYPDFTPGPKPESWRDDGPPRAVIPTTAPKENRFTAATPAAPTRAAVDPSKFPGGIVPTQLPAKRMQGRVRSARGR